MKIVAALAVMMALTLLPPAGVAKETRHIDEPPGDVQTFRLQVLDVGFYTARKTGQTRVAPSSAAGADQILSDVQFLPVPPADRARIGTQFGVRFRSVGEPRNAEVTLRSVWRIPPPGITNPNNNKTYRQSVVEFKYVTGTELTRGYGFDEPWEIVRGTWTLEIWHGDRKLLEENFKIE